MSTTREEFFLIDKIVDRAEKEGIMFGSRLTLNMDLGFTHKQVGLKLQELLEADELNFMHDICGIQRHMNRETCQLEGFFLPRFAMPKKE